MKAVSEDVGFTIDQAEQKCKDLGGFVLSPMNEKYTKDIEDLLSSLTDVNQTDFWIGKEDSWV